MHARNHQELHYPDDITVWELLNQGFFRQYTKAGDFTFSGTGKINGKLCLQFVSKKSLTMTNIMNRCGSAFKDKKPTQTCIQFSLKMILSSIAHLCCILPYLVNVSLKAFQANLFRKRAQYVLISLI